MTDALWTEWQQDWRRMEALAVRRGWELTPLRIAPPASAAALRRVETRHGLTVPLQLRELLRTRSARVTFGWHIPSHLQPMEKLDMPVNSIGVALWDLADIDAYAIPNFLGWKHELAEVDLCEAPNRPEMWEAQFPFYSLGNGDMLTIDMSNPDGPQPVRYFSHELAMLHGLALAPDLFGFISEMSKLGFAGTEYASWLRFGTMVGDTYYLDAAGEGGRSWRAWIERDPAERGPSEPPPTVVATTSADHALLAAARAGDRRGVLAALANGAKPDAAWDPSAQVGDAHWGDEYCTAVGFAVRHDNLDMLEALLRHGAMLDTRRPALEHAVQYASLPTVIWLIAQGARVDGWSGQRHWPLHLLVTRRGEHAQRSKAEYEHYLASQGWPRAPHEIAAALARHLDEPAYLAMVEALLKAGADPDAPWDNGITMLMWGSVACGQLLLTYGADVAHRDAHGWTALHRVRIAEKVHLLAAHGADVNAVATPADADELAYTPLQSTLLTARAGSMSVARALLDCGADPKVRDSKGRSTLCYCSTVEGFALVLPYGLDPNERLPGGGTLLHNLLWMTSVRASFPEEVAFLDFLLALGLDINAVDDEGKTMLHVAAKRIETPADMALLLDRGADKTIKDGAGKRPFHLVPRSLKEVRALLK